MKANQMLVMAGAAIVMLTGVNKLVAQENPPGRDRGRGGFDPAQFQKMRMDRLHEALEIKDDAEWKAIEPLITKVSDAQRQAMADMGRGMIGGGRSGRSGGDSTSGNNNSSDRSDRSRGGFFGTPSPEAEALQKAIDSKASSSEIKAALAKYTEARKAKQAALEKAQADLRKVLTPRQEAIAALSGLL